MDLLIVDLKKADLHTYLHLKQANIPGPHYISTEANAALHFEEKKEKENAGSPV